MGEAPAVVTAWSLDLSSKPPPPCPAPQAAETMSSINVDVLIEPINARSIPGYHLSSFVQADQVLEAAAERCARAGLRPPKLLFDFFHAQMICGAVTPLVKAWAARIGHIQIAGVPHRAEPDELNELNYPFILGVLREEVHWNGHIGCEYVPRGTTHEGLGWWRRQPDD